MPRNALGHALGQNNIENFELLRGFITIQGIVGGGLDVSPRVMTPEHTLHVWSYISLRTSKKT